MRSQNTTMLPQSNDRLDQELATWFSQRAGPWSGTAAELLISVRSGSNVGSLWPESPRGLYEHLKAHRQMLLSLGVDVLLPHGVPRMVSLRSCPNEFTLSKPPLAASEIDPVSDSPSNLLLPVDGQKAAPAADSGDAGSAACETFHEEIPMAESDLAGRYVSTKYAAGSTLEGRVFADTAEALVAIGEMRQQIREQGLDLKSAVDVVISAALGITRSYRIAVGFLPQKTMGQPPRTGGGASMKGLHFDANLFQPRLMAGEAVQLQDPQKDPILGSKFRREGVGSLIIVPIFRDQEVAGAMEFLFHEKLNFSAGDVMDLGLVAGVISESLGNVALGGVKQVEERESRSETRAIDNIELQPGQSSNEKEDPGDHRPNTVRGTIHSETGLPESASPESMVLKSLASTRLAAAPTLFWRGLKRAWIGHSRGK